MKFWKMEACGNDFILIRRSSLTQDPTDRYLSDLARTLCALHTGIGADGLILLSEDPLTMTFYNADGSEGAMCGNGLRCFIALADRLGLTPDHEALVHTKAGLMSGRVLSRDLVEENLGHPVLSCQALEMKTTEKEWRDKPIAYDGGEVNATCLQMGALHCVVFAKALPTDEARSLHASPLFKDRMNVSFVEILNDHEIHVRTYERGVGWTLSCGSGTCASVWCAHEQGLVGREVTAHEPTGDLRVSLHEDGVHLIGPARFVATGETE